MDAARGERVRAVFWGRRKRQTADKDKQNRQENQTRGRLKGSGRILKDKNHEAIFKSI